MHRSLLGFSIHPLTLAGLSAVVIGMTLLAASAHVEALILAATPDALEQSLRLEEDVAVILIAFGVFLEERGLLATRAFGGEADDRQEAWNESSERYGAYLLLLGLLMEVNDQVFEPLLLEHGFATLGIGSMVMLDALAMIVCLAYIAAMLRRG